MISRALDTNSRPWFLYGLAVAAVAFVVLAIAQLGPPTSSARTATQIVTAEQGVVQSTVSGTGNVEPGTDVNVNFPTSGTLSKVYVTSGQDVTKGQLLATLDQSSANLALDQANQSLTAAEDQLSTAETSTTSSSSTSTTSSAATVASAQAAVDGAASSVNTAKSALAATKLYAPISGTIVSLASLSPGDSISAGTTGTASTTSSSSSGSSGSGSTGTAAGGIGGAGASSTSPSSSSTSSTSGSSSPFAEIVNTKTMTMTVAFSESDITKVKVGQPATVTMDALAGVQLGARVTAISTVGTTSSNVVSYSATLRLDQNDAQIKPGMSASTAVIVGQAQGVTVPNAAVNGTGSVATVTMLKNGKRTQQQVAVGLRGTSRTQIVSGLRAGDQLVVTTTLSSPSSSSSSSSAGSGTLGASGARPGGIGGAGGGGFGGGAGGGFGGRLAAGG